MYISMKGIIPYIPETSFSLYFLLIFLYNFKEPLKATFKKKKTNKKTYFLYPEE